MKRSMFASITAVLLWTGVALAGELSRIDLKDGSSLTGEVVALSGGIYTIKSESLGAIQVEQSKIRSIQAVSGGAAANNTGVATGEMQSLQQKMMRDQEIMAKIQSLQNDPEFKALLDDPKIMNAVNTGDVAALSADPRFLKLLNNPTVREIQGKVK